MCRAIMSSLDNNIVRILYMYYTIVHVLYNCTLYVLLISGNLDNLGIYIICVI